MLHRRRPSTCSATTSILLDAWECLARLRSNGRVGGRGEGDKALEFEVACRCAAAIMDTVDSPSMDNFDAYASTLLLGLGVDLAVLVHR